jgi:hypothetical protein
MSIPGLNRATWPVVVLSLLAAAFVYAADGTDAVSVDAGEATTENAPPPAPSDAARGNKDFTPSEEVSADQEVDFPADM